MAISIITHAIKQSSDKRLVTTDAVDTSGADLLFLAAARGTAGSSRAISDSKSNSWTARSTYSFASGLEMTLYYSIPTSVGSSHTFTFNNSDDVFPSLAMIAISGGKQSSPYDVENGNTDFGTTSLATGSVTPSEDNEILITAAIHNTSTAATVDSGFTRSDHVELSAGAAYGMAMAYLIQTTATAKNPTWSGSGIGAVSVATFKAAAASSPEETIVRQSICVPFMR